MEHNQINPFSISKANDLSDSQIDELWVDDMDFSKFIEPTSLKPKIIIGGKGSGKTHLLRYFSFNVRITKEKSIKNMIKNDGYIGIFIRASTLFGSKFNHKTDKEKWKVIFYYYFELFITNKYLFPILKQLIKEYPKKEKQLAIAVNELFDYQLTNKKTLKDIEESIVNEIKSINLRINKYSFDNSSINNIKPSVSKTNLLFGIPNIVKDIFNNIPKINDLVFNYFIDEFENFEPEQQKYVQTIVRERGDSCTFRLGIRTYHFGEDTLKTEHSTESNKIGSELETIFLDGWLMDDKHKYHDFVIKIIQKKFDPKKINSYASYEKYLKDLFETDHKKINSEKAFIELGKELKKSKISDANQKKIIKNLKIVDDKKDKSIIEKINIYRFYKLGESSSDFVNMSINIKKECKSFLKGDNSIYKNLLEKQKENMFAQLCKENGVDNSIYLGLKNLINISFFNPRHFINLMSYIYEYSDYYDKDINDGITADIQIKALKKLLNWFEDDYDKTGEYGYKLKEYSDRICRYLEAIRFSPKPQDTSVTKFYISNENFTKYKNQLNDLSNRLIFIDSNKVRLGKNPNNFIQDKHFQINYIYSEKYKLPVISRGTIELKDVDLQVIFCGDEQKFRKLILKKTKQMNAKKNRDMYGD